MRIQILTLPAVVNGDDLEEPFALVFDQIDDDVNKDLLYEFARQCGARTHVMLPQTVEIVDRYADDGPAADADIERFCDEVARSLARHYGGWYPDRERGL